MARAAYRGREWCYTLNNYTNDEVLRLKDLTGIKYHVFGKEVGEQGTPHLQGYIVFTSAKTVSACKAVMGDRIHIEKREGKPWQAARYCKKEGDFWECGECPKGQGARSDLVEIADQIRSGATLKRVAEEFPSQFIRYSTGIKRFKFTVDTPPSWREVTVRVLWGRTGAGKTREATQCDSYFILTDEWFDGYAGETRLIIDDFYGWLKWGTLLRITDGNKYQCNVKGSKVWAKWTEVYITSNVAPREWYSMQSVDERKFSALERRIDQVVHYE